MMKKAYISLFLLSLTTLLFGQDLHFTQFSENQQYINPALIGKFNGQHKYNMSFRSQWRSVTVPYRSFGAAYESSQLAGNKFLNGGFSLYRDKAGDSEYTVTQIAIALSYSVKLTQNSALSLGIQTGINSYSLDLSKLKFESQYKPDIGYTSTASNQENLSRFNFINPDLNIGLCYFGNFGWGFLKAGYAMYHVIPTDVHFYTANANPTDVRNNIFVSTSIKSNQNNVNLALVRSMHQTLDETVFEISYDINMLNDNGFFRIGNVTRLGDATAAVLGFKFASWYFGYSYDFNYSDLTQSSNGKGASELSISYLYKPIKSYKRRFDSCPVFL